MTENNSVPATIAPIHQTVEGSVTAPLGKISLKVLV
jgi:hypothetical protein